MEQVPQENPEEHHDHMQARMLILGEISIQEAFDMEQDSIERALGERPELPDFHD